MGDYIERAGDDYAQRIVKAAAEAFKEGKDLDWDLKHFHLLAAWDTTLESKCLDQVRSLSEPSPWQVLPDWSRTTAWRSRVFCMLSTLGCLCHDMRVYHEGFPFKLFGILLDDD